MTYQHSELLSSANSTEQAKDWVRNNGDQFVESIGFGNTVIGTEFDTFEMLAGWTYDSRNRALFANRGMRQQLVFGVTVPGSDVEYFTAR